MTSLRFTPADLERANSEWGCNCGPASFAAICGLTLEETHVHFSDFAGWCAPSTMHAALSRRAPLLDWSRVSGWPRYGLALIQFEGPWTEPNPARERWLRIERAKRTHWIGVARQDGFGPAVWDINALGRGSDRDGWVWLAEWERDLVPILTADIKRASGGWHITYAIEVVRSEWRM